MTSVWVVDSNCFIHLGAIAPDSFIGDLQKILKEQSMSIFVTPGVHDEVRTVKFQRWSNTPNLLDTMRNLLNTITIDDSEIRVLAKKIGEKASPQDVDLSLMVLASKMSKEGKDVTLVSDDFKMTLTGSNSSASFETCPPSTFIQRISSLATGSQKNRLRSLSRRVRAAEMRYAISRAGQYDIQEKLTWMVDSLLTSQVNLDPDVDSSSISDDRKLISGLIRSIRGEVVKKSILNKLGSLPEVCTPVATLDTHLSSISSDKNSDDVAQKYVKTAQILSEVLESTGIGLAPLDEEMAEIAHRAMAGHLYRMESALGLMAKMSGNLSASRLHLARALHSATLVDDVGAEMRAMHQLGLLALATDDWSRAAPLFETSDRQAQLVGANRLPHLVTAAISRHLNGDHDLASSHIKAASSLVQRNKAEATDVLAGIGKSLLAVDCPGLAIEVFDEAMECAIESEQSERLELIADNLLLANTAMTNREQSQFDGLRQLLDELNEIHGDAMEEFESRITEIDQRSSEFAKPLDETWTEWQDVSRLISDGQPLKVLRIDEDEAGRALVITHHSEIGALGLWLPEGGIQAAPGNLIQITGSKIKVATPTDSLREMHNIRGLVAIQNPEVLTFSVRTEEIVDEEDEN